MWRLCLQLNGHAETFIDPNLVARTLVHKLEPKIVLLYDPQDPTYLGKKLSPAAMYSVLFSIHLGIHNIVNWGPKFKPCKKGQVDLQDVYVLERHNVMIVTKVWTWY